MFTIQLMPFSYILQVGVGCGGGCEFPGKGGVGGGRLVK